MFSRNLGRRFLQQQQQIETTSSLSAATSSSSSSRPTSIAAALQFVARCSSVSHSAAIGRPSSRWLAFESRGSKFQQQHQQQMKMAQQKQHQEMQQQQQQQQASATNSAGGGSGAVAGSASDKFSNKVREWRRMKAAAYQGGGGIASVRSEFIKSFEELRGGAVFSEVPIDAAFSVAMLDAAAVLLPQPLRATLCSAHHQFDLLDAASGVPPIPADVCAALRVVIDWAVSRRQQVGETAGGSADNVLALYALHRIGPERIFGSSVSDSTSSSSSSNGGGASQQQQQQQQQYLLKVQRTLMVNPRELRSLPPESLALAAIACSLAQGRGSASVAEACLLRLLPILKSTALLPLAHVAAVVYDPALTAAVGGDRTVVALREALNVVLAKTGAEKAAEEQPAVVASILSSLLRDTTASEPVAAADVVRRFAEAFEKGAAGASPRCVLEVVRAFAESSDRPDFACSRVAADAGSAMVAVLDKVLSQGVESAVKGATASDFDFSALFCLFEIYRYLSLPSVEALLLLLLMEQKEGTAAAAAKEVVDRVRALSCAAAPLVVELLSLDSCDDQASCLAVSLLNALAHEVAMGRPHEQKEGDGSTTSLQEKRLGELSDALLKVVSGPVLLSASSSSSSSTTAPVPSRYDPRLHHRIAALLCVPGFLAKKELRALVSALGNSELYSSSVPDVTVIIQALARAVVNNNMNSSSRSSSSGSDKEEDWSLSSSIEQQNSDARQLARALAPVRAIPNASVAHVVRLAHFYGMLRVRDEPLCQAMVGRVCALRDDLSAEELAAFLFALARMDERSNKPYVDLMPRVKLVTAGASASAATGILVAYARAAVVWNYTAYFRLCERIVEVQATLSRRDMLPLLMALLRLDLRHERLIDIITKEVVVSVGGMVQRWGSESGDNSTAAKHASSSSSSGAAFPVAWGSSSASSSSSAGGGPFFFAISPSAGAAAAPFSVDECVRLLACLSHINPDTPALEPLGTFFAQRQDQLSAVQLGDVLSALGRCAPERARPIFEQLVLRAIALMPTAPPVALATTVAGFAALGYPHEEVFSLVSGRLLRFKEECPALIISQVLTSFAAVGLRDDKLFVEMIPRVRYVAHHGSAQDVANVLTAYTTVQLWHYKLFVRLAERAIAVRADARPHHVAQIVAAFAKVEMRYDKLFIELSPRIQVVSCSAAAADVATIVDAYARMNLYDAPVFSTLADRALQIPSHFSPEAAYTVLAAFDKLSVTHDALKKALGKLAEQHEEFLEQQKAELEKNAAASAAAAAAAEDRDEEAGEGQNFV